MSDTYDVVFVIIDSARKKRLSAYGHRRETTPAFDALASEATLYENAFTPAPWTLPSHCSMFTGRFPTEHGITNGFTDRSLKLDPTLQTIPQKLSERGYVTAGFSNNPWVGQLSGLDRGFDQFVEWDLEVSRSSGIVESRRRDEIYSRLHSVIGRAARQPHALVKRPFFTSNLVDRATRWIVETSDQPSFTFMNLMEAHSPYYPPKRAFQKLGLDSPGVIESRLLNARLLAYVLGKSDLHSETRDRVLEYYDAALRYQDEQLERLLSTLREQGRFEDTMIVICADHGKTIGDFDRDGTPPHYVRDVNVNVPLLIKWPRQDVADRVTHPVELVDLFDAIDNVGTSRSLPARDDGALVEDHIPHTASNATAVDRWRVLADDSYKYVRSENGDEFLFERGTGETRIDLDESVVATYRQRLQRRLNGLDTKTDTIDEDEPTDLGGNVEGQLRDLGYLG